MKWLRLTIGARPVYRCQQPDREVYMIRCEVGWLVLYHDIQQMLACRHWVSTMGEARRFGMRFMTGNPKPHLVWFMSSPANFAELLEYEAVVGDNWQRGAFDVPMLHLSGAACEVIQPVVKWGSMSRFGSMEGTYHFYTEDRQFTALWQKPDQLLASGCRAAVEPNYSTSEWTPEALVLGDIYQKRWLARYWQDHGIKTFVDVNVHVPFGHLALIGVPEGWPSYMTRSTGSDFDLLLVQNEWAWDRCGKRPYFVVYGGGKEVQYFCESQSWEWIPEHSRTVREA